MYLLITDTVAQRLLEHRQHDTNPLESGGILLGSYYESYIKIENITTPGIGDKQGPSFFYRDKNRAQALVNQAFYDSNGTNIYIGEWHTHDEANPSPSSIDRTQIKSALMKSKLHFGFLVSIIVGNRDFIGNLCVGYQDITRLVECSHIPITC